MLDLSFLYGIFLLVLFGITLIYLLSKIRKNLSPSWRATSNGLCEICKSEEAILTNEASGLEVCEFCDNLLP